MKKEWNPWKRIDEQLKLHPQLFPPMVLKYSPPCIILECNVFCLAAVVEEEEEEKEVSTNKREKERRSKVDVLNLVKQLPSRVTPNKTQCFENKSLLKCVYSLIIPCHLHISLVTIG